MTAPLTEEQRALWVQWLPYSRKLAYSFLRRAPWLRYMEEDVVSAAECAGANAVRKWDPKRGTYVSCLHWWVVAALQDVAKVHGRHVLDVSLDVDVGVHLGGGGHSKRPDAERYGEFHEITPDESLPDPDACMDAARLTARAEDEITARLTNPKTPETTARVNARIFLAFLQGDGYTDAVIAKTAKAMGVSRNAVFTRKQRAERAFEAWAEEVRDEAA